MKKAKYMKSIAVFTIACSMAVSLFFFSGCGEQKQTENENSGVEQPQDIDDVSLPFDQRLKNFIERKLSIPSTENYRLKVYEEHLNDDGKKDVLITVNRYEYAVKKAEEDGRVTKASTLGFFGNHNYVFYYSSITNKFTGPFTIGSTPQRELNIAFENISSTNHKDFVVDYAIRNSQFRKVYLMMDDLPHYAFQWKVYDGWGTDELEAYCFDYGTGSYSTVKDIVVNKAEMKNIEKGDDYDAIDPEITCTEILVKRFFFNEQDRKYYTPN